MNERLLSLITDAGPVHLGDNLLRHSPIMMKIKIEGLTASNRQQGVPTVRRPAWYKATQEHKEQYTDILEEKLSGLTPPANLGCRNANCQDAEHTRERDSYVLDIMGAVMEASYECIPLSTPHKPDKRKGNTIPGWKENVEPVKKDALFWHGVLAVLTGENYTKLCAGLETNITMLSEGQRKWQLL